MVFRYVTGNLVQFTITYYVTTAATNPTASGCLADGECTDDYNVVAGERCTFVSSALVLRNDKSIAPMTTTTTTIETHDFSLHDFRNCAASDPSEAKNSEARIFLLSFCLCESDE